MKSENQDIIGSCPCLYLEEPCHPSCTCVNGASSLGCLFCCTYGSIEQRKEKALHLANKLRPIPQEAPKPTNPFACYGNQRPHPMDFDDKDEYIVRIMKYDNWERQNNQQTFVELTCMSCGETFTGPEPLMCCDGNQCGCMGLPIDPVVCSEECYDNLMSKYNGSPS